MLDALFALAILLVSVIIHENAHGWTALALGDDTAKKAKRLTLNPVRHLDIVGSIILPAVMWFSAQTMFGYAKPVPVTPSKLRGSDRWGFALVAAAGPASNLVLAFIAATLLKAQGPIDPTGFNFLFYVFSLNMLLAAFNLLPIPPLDGSRILRLFLSTNGRATLDRIEPYGFLILLVLIVWLGEPLFRVVSLIERGLLRLLPV